MARVWYWANYHAGYSAAFAGIPATPFGRYNSNSCKLQALPAAACSPAQIYSAALRRESPPVSFTLKLCLRYDELFRVYSLQLFRQERVYLSIRERHILQLLERRLRFLVGFEIGTRGADIDGVQIFE